MKLNIHDYNLQMVAALLEVYPEVWIHGSGDIFNVYKHDPLDNTQQDHSKNHAENYNTGHEENGYRVKLSRANFSKSTTVKDVENMIMRAKAMEDVEKEQKAQNPNSRVSTIRVPETDFRGDTNQPAGEIDYTKFNKSNAEK